MPRNKTPDNVLKLRGADKKDPQRMRERGEPPKDDRALGRVPSHLNAEEKAAWREIVSSAPPGLLQRSDRVAVEIAARLLITCRSGEANAAMQAQLVRLLGKLGCTPGDRGQMRIPTDKPEESNPFAEFD